MCMAASFHNNTSPDTNTLRAPSCFLLCAKHYPRDTSIFIPYLDANIYIIYPKV